MDQADDFRPRPAGELAMLSYPYPPRELAGCQLHLFRLHEPEPVRISECQSGYLQRADCLVCGRTTARMDASWWNAAPTAEALAASLPLIEARRHKARPEEK